MAAINVARLIDACSDDASDAGVVFRTTLAPLAGEGAPVKPAVYEGGNYQIDERWYGEGDDRKPTTVIVIDNVPSQANRIEAALAKSAQRLGLPELVLDLSSAGPLPAHLPTSISSFLLPHRNADAYLRDASLDGQKFPRTALGRALFTATADDPGALLSWMPQALLFGFWQSHLGKKGPQSKLARSWVSEIVGYAPATTSTKVFGLKGDPLNLSIDDAVTYDEDRPLDWSVGDDKKAGKAKSKDSLSEIGHGQVPVAGAPGGVSFRSIEQQASLSIAGLRRLNLPAEGRALVAAIGLVGHALAFGRSMSLRSGCELRRASSTCTWLGADGDEQVEAISAADAAQLLAEACDAARSAGLELEGWGRSPLRLEPSAELAKVIAKTYPPSEDF